MHFASTENDYIYKVVVRDADTDVPVQTIHGYENPEVIDTVYSLKIMELVEIDQNENKSDPADLKADTMSDSKREHKEWSV